MPKIVFLILVIIIITLIMKYIIYKYTGWTKFNMSYLQNFLVNTPPENVSKIKFSKCIFKVKSTTGVEASTDVTANLNKMVAAYEGNKDERYKFKLDDPGLNSASFILPGITDSGTIKDSTTFPLDWKDTENVSLEGSYKLFA